MELWVVILIGLVGGIAVGIQSPIAGAMGQKIGGVASSFIIHFGGMVFSGLFLIIRGGEKIRDWSSLPWYMLGAGLLGLILYQTINVTLPRLGGAMMITLIIVGQLLTGLVVDQFGLFGTAVRQIDLPKVLGIIALLGGAYLISR